MRARAQDAAERARRRPSREFPGVFIFMRVAATSQLGPQAGFESSAVLRRRGCLYFCAEGVRGPTVRSLRGSATREDMK